MARLIDCMAREGAALHRAAERYDGYTGFDPSRLAEEPAGAGPVGGDQLLERELAADPDEVGEGKLADLLARRAAQHVDAHEDGGQRIPEVMRNDGEQILAGARGPLRVLVQPSVVDADGGTLRDLLGEAQIARRVAAA